MAQEKQTKGNTPTTSQFVKSIGDWIHGTGKSKNAIAEAVVGLVDTVKTATNPVPDTILIASHTFTGTDDKGNATSRESNVTYGDLREWTQGKCTTTNADGSKGEDVTRISRIKSTLIASSSHGAALVKAADAATREAKDKTVTARHLKDMAKARAKQLDDTRKAAGQMVTRVSLIGVAYIEGCAFGQQDLARNDKGELLDKDGNVIPLGDNGALSAEAAEKVVKVDVMPRDIRAKDGTLQMLFHFRDSKGRIIEKWEGFSISGQNGAEALARKFLRPDTAKGNGKRGTPAPGTAPTQRDVVKFTPEAFALIVNDENNVGDALKGVSAFIGALNAKDAMAKHKDALANLIDDVLQLAVDAGLAARVASELEEMKAKRGNGNGKGKPADKEPAKA